MYESVVKIFLKLPTKTGSRIKTRVDSSDLAQTRVSLGRLASLRQVRRFTKFLNGVILKLSYPLTRESRLCAVLKLRYSPSLFCFESPQSHRHRWPSVVILIVAGPLSSVVVAASLVLTHAPSFASRHDAKVISPLSPLLS